MTLFRLNRDGHFPIPVILMVITSRKKILFEIVSIEQFEDYLRQEFIHFKSMDNLQGIEREELLQSLAKKTHIGIKKFRKVFVKNYINCQTQYNTNYWLQRGYTLQEATNEVLTIQKKNNIKAVETMQKLKKNDFAKYKKKMNIYIEFWIEKGFSKDEALIKLKDRQSTFTLEKLIQKHGKEEGLKKYTERNEKWLISLYGKMNPEEKLQFEKSKCVTKNKMIAKYGEDVALQKWKNYIKSHFKMWEASGISKKYIDEIIYKIGSDECKNETIFFGTDEKSEFYLYDKETMSLYWYDLTFFDRKKIIEFDGVHVHPDPDATEEEKNKWKQSFTGKSFEEVLLKDISKQKLAIQNGFEVLRIRLPKHSNNISKEIIDQCVQFIKNKKND